MSSGEQVVDRFYRHLTRLFVLRQSVAAVTAWAFLWGTAILVLRATQGTSLLTLLWGALGLPVAIALAARLALRRLPDRSAVRALLDGKGACGGLLMAGAECDLGTWRAEPGAGAALRPCWRGKRALGFLAAASAYVALAALLPARGLAVGEPRLDVTRPAERLMEQVRVLQEEKILDPERADNLKQKIDELRAQAAGKDPAKTLEALDHLNDVVHQAARQAAETKARQATQLGQLGAAADALTKVAPELDPQQQTDLMKELAALAQKAAGENEALREQAPELADALKEGKLSAEQLAKLSAAAKSGKDSLAKSAKKLHDAKLIDKDQLKACEGGTCDGDELAKYLSKQNIKKSLKQALQKQEGKGGVSEDEPGDTPLVFGDRSTENGAKFKEEALPPAELAALKDSLLSGTSKALPTPDPKAPPAQAGALAGARAGGGSANTAPVLPQHRGTVERYFDRPMK
jgi:hypothetical protein